MHVPSFPALLHPACRRVLWCPNKVVTRGCDCPCGMQGVSDSPTAREQRGSLVKAATRRYQPLLGAKGARILSSANRSGHTFGHDLAYVSFGLVVRAAQRPRDFTSCHTCRRIHCKPVAGASKIALRQTQLCSRVLSMLVPCWSIDHSLPSEPRAAAAPISMDASR